MRAKTYRIVVKHSVLRDIRHIPQVVVDHLRSSIAALAENPFPRGVEKIQGCEHCYRLRVGKYRVIYEVETVVRIITIIRIGHRENIYRDL